MKLRYSIFLVVFALFTACEFDESTYRYNLGEDFINDPTRVIMIDTLTVKTYTTAIDSIVTSQGERFLVGKTKNSLGIVTTCEAYFRLDPTDQTEFSESAVFDSACFIIYPDGYKFGDTTIVSSLAIHSLTEDITVDDETEYIYNNTQFACEPTALVSFNIDMNNEYDSVSVLLPENYGKRLFDLAFTNDSLIADKDTFNIQYKGFVIKSANQQNSFIMGFNAVPDSTTSPKIRIYYHDNSTEDDLYFDYPIENYKEYTGEKFTASSTYDNTYAFNHIKNDYSQSDFKDIKTGSERLSSDVTGNVTLLQGGLNLRTRVEIPYIDNLYALGIGSVVKAVLYFEPVEGTYNLVEDLPTGLEMYLIDSKNRSYGLMYDIDGKTATTSSLNFNTEFKNQTFYAFDITRFLRDEYISKGDPEYSLLMALPQSGINSRVDQLIIGSQANPNNSIRLKIYLTNY